MRDGSACRRARVIIAEDDAALRELVAAEIRELGHFVDAVPNGGRLLVALGQALKSNGLVPDLIISDIRMPVVSGLAMASAMREIRREIRFILMTAFPSEDVVRKAHALRAHLLPKPFALDALLNLVTSCLSEGRGCTRGAWTSASEAKATDAVPES